MAEEVAARSASKPGKNKKNKAAKELPPQEIIDFTRNKRALVRALKADQKQFCHCFIENLGDLERSAIGEHLGCSATQWIESEA